MEHSIEFDAERIRVQINTHEEHWEALMEELGERYKNVLMPEKKTAKTEDLIYILKTLHRE